MDKNIVKCENNVHVCIKSVRKSAENNDLSMVIWLIQLNKLAKVKTFIEHC